MGRSTLKKMVLVAAPATALTGAAVIALGAAGGRLYSGDQRGTVYRVTP